MSDLAGRSLRVALSGFVHDDDPTIIADMMAEIDRLRAENERLRERLEITHVWQSVGGGPLERVPAPEGIPDGIECRDETIKLQDARIAELEGERDRLADEREEEILAEVIDRCGDAWPDREKLHYNDSPLELISDIINERDETRADSLRLTAALRTTGVCMSCVLNSANPCTDCLGTGWNQGENPWEAAKRAEGERDTATRALGEMRKYVSHSGWCAQNKWPAGGADFKPCDCGLQRLLDRAALSKTEGKG